MNMTTFFENQYVKISIFEINRIKCLDLVWFPTTENMRDDEYRECVKKYEACVAIYQTKLTLIDTTKFFFTIPIASQNWINEEIFPKNIANGLQKQAIITSPDFFPKLSVELTLEENPNLGFDVMYFEEKNAAEIWLASFTKQKLSV